MAASDSVPRVVHNYYYDHFPPPSDSTELAAELRRGLRTVPHGGFWCKVKSAGLRLLLKFDNGSRFEQPFRRPDFPVAPPSSPIPRTRRISPDIHIQPAGRPDYLLSPPRLQEDGFLFVPARSFRASRRRQERLPPSSRQLPPPPGLPPACPIPKITCCPLANTPSSSSSSLSSSSANSDVDSAELDCASFLAEFPPFLFFPDEEKENNPDCIDQKSQDPDTPEHSAVAGSSNMAPQVPQDDGMIMSSSQTEEIQHAAADRHFLEELGLTPEAFIALLDGTGIEWDDDEDDNDDDDEEDEDEDDEEEEEGEEGEGEREEAEEEDQD